MLGLVNSDCGICKEPATRLTLNIVVGTSRHTSKEHESAHHMKRVIAKTEEACSDGVGHHDDGPVMRKKS